MPRRPLPAPAYNHDGITLYHGKAEAVVPLLASSGVTVDAVVTDPPFGIGYNYGKAHEDGKNDYGEQGYGPWLWGIIEQCEAMCNPGSPLFVWQAMLNVRHFSDWFPRDYRLFAACKNFTSSYQGVSMQHAWDPVVVWYKRGAGYVAGNNFSSKDWHLSNTAKLVTETWDMAKDHPCPRPLDSIRFVVSQFVKPGGLVLDPFLGSGTAAVACLEEGRRCVGVEKDERYLDIAVRRLNDRHGAGAVTEMRKQLSKISKPKGKRGK